MSTDKTGQQANLFPDVEYPVVYEQPLLERIRNCLRLEHLFLGIESGIRNGGKWDARDAISRILEVCDFMIRTDIKGELIKELERNVSVLGGLRNKPGVDPAALDRTLETIGEILKSLKPSEYQPGSRFRNNELASQIRQRSSIPGGTCNFDVPALHFWLNADAATRQTHLNEWMEDLRVVEKAAGIILKLIRDSSRPRIVTAASGFYQQQIEANTQCQIVRVVMPCNAQVFPEISGGKHRFTVRFLSQSDTRLRPSQISDDISFELHCCGI